MKIKLHEDHDHKSQLRIEDASVAYVNTLRRIFQKNVYTMAVDTVEFKENTSALYDEILAHRIGLVVLSTDVGAYNVADEGAEPTSATHATLSLQAEGPKIVTAADFEAQSANVKPVHEDTVIVELLEGQSLELIATAKLGTGQDHAKHDPGLTSYYIEPSIEVENNDSLLEEFKDDYPPQIFEDGEIKAELINTPQLIDACEGVCDELVSITYDNDSPTFVFTIEPWGQLTATEIVEEGIRVYNEDLEAFEEALQEIA